MGIGKQVWYTRYTKFDCDKGNINFTWGAMINHISFDFYCFEQK